MRKICLLLVVSLVSGCASTSLTSVRSAPNEKLAGTTYSLPTARVTAAGVSGAARFALRVALPPFIPDPASGLYAIGYKGSPVENDKVQIEVEGGLLKTVNIASENKLLDAVEGGGQSIGAIAAMIESAVTPDQADTPITVRFDPTVATQVTTASQDLTKALHNYAREQLALDGLREPPKATDKAALAENALRSHLLTTALTATISLQGLFPSTPATGIARRAFAIARFARGSLISRSTARVSPSLA
jgi:uncharacterized protein YceK